MSWENSIDIIDSLFLQDILRQHFGRTDCVVKNFKRRDLSTGLDTELTGGGLYLFELDGWVGDEPAPSLVLKATPSFKSGQEAVIRKLDKLGHLTLANLLKKFPSNKIAEREVKSYQYLPTKIPLRMPILYHLRFDPETGSAWLFLEDLTPYQSLPAGDQSWTKTRLRGVLRQMAAFHSVFWGETATLSDQDWLGRWWTEQKSDYVSPEIAQYLVDACARMHPSVLTKTRHHLLNTAIGERPRLHREFTREPQTVIHWDFGPSNLRFDKSAQVDRELIVFDWQTTSIGLPQWDIAQLLIPCLDITEAEVVDSLIEDYINFLPLSIRSTLDLGEFRRLFDLVVLDHFFRVCWPILFSGRGIKTDDTYFLEWKHALSWIENRSARWLGRGFRQQEG